MGMEVGLAGLLYVSLTSQHFELKLIRDLAFDDCFQSLAMVLLNEDILELSRDYNDYHCVLFLALEYINGYVRCCGLSKEAFSIERRQDLCLPEI